MPKVQETILEINLKALEENFQFLKSRLNPGTKFMAIVKAFAYGSDAVIISRQLQQLGVDYLAVAYTREGIVLRDAGINVPIMVLHPQAVNFKTIIDRCLEPSLYNERSLMGFLEVAKDSGQINYPVHIKFNTGLNRLGFKNDDVDLIFSLLKNSPSIRVKSLFSHLVASEDLNVMDFSRIQIEKFLTSASKLTDLLGYRSLLHMLNTSGILNYPEAQFDMVRSGIGLYGFGNSPEYRDKLKPIASLKSIISQIHHIKKGENVGYNFGYLSDGDKKTATIPIGHADGISRQYGNGKGAVRINGHTARILGNVCMDMIMVDVTQIECKEGDEVVIFDDSTTAADFAGTVDTISYEILTAISQRVARRIVGQ